MSMTQNGRLAIDDNDKPVMGGTSSSDNATIINSSFDPITRRLLTDSAGGGTGTVTSVSVVTANGFAGTVATATTTPAITLTTSVTGLVKGNGTALSAAVANSDYQSAITLTTTGTTGVATFNGVTLNIPNYTATVPTTITVANEASDTSCFVAFFTAATGDLGPKTNAGLTFNSNTGVLTSTFVGNLTGNVTGDASGNAGTVTVANEATDTTCFVNFTTAVSGTLPIKTNTNMTFNANTGVVTFASSVLTAATVSTTLTMADTANIVFNTSTGTKIGTGTTQKLAFYNSTPVVQPTGDVVTALQNLGLVASATIASGTNINTATESTDTTCFPVFVTASGTQTLPAKTNTTLTYNSNTNDLGITKINGLTMTASTGTFSLTNAKTFVVTNGLTLSGSDSSTMTFPSTSASIARIDAAQTFTGSQQFANAVLYTQNSIAASGNAATVPVTSRINTVTNNSAATLTITMTTGAVDRQLSEVLILDSSAVAQSITWVNTENSTVTVPVTSNGSTSLPLSVLFQYNNATGKWRCIASA